MPLLTSFSCFYDWGIEYQVRWIKQNENNDRWRAPETIFLRISIAIQRISIAIQRISIAIQRISIVIQRISIATQRISIAIQRIYIAIQRISIAIQPISIAIQRCNAVFSSGTFIQHSLINLVTRDLCFWNLILSAGNEYES